MKSNNSFIQKMCRLNWVIFGFIIFLSAALSVRAHIARSPFGPSARNKSHLSIAEKLLPDLTAPTAINCLAVDS
jgi:hypothetical protein